MQLGAGLPKRQTHSSTTGRKACRALLFAGILPKISIFPCQRLPAHCTLDAQSKEKTFSLVKNINLSEGKINGKHELEKLSVPTGGSKPPC